MLLLCFTVVPIPEGDSYDVVTVIYSCADS